MLELYNLTEEFSRSNNIADKYLKKFKALKEKFIAEVRKYQVFPLDASVAGRLVALRLNITAGRSEL